MSTFSVFISWSAAAQAAFSAAPNFRSINCFLSKDAGIPIPGGTAWGPDASNTQVTAHANTVSESDLSKSSNMQTYAAGEEVIQYDDVPAGSFPILVSAIDNSGNIAGTGLAGTVVCAPGANTFTGDPNLFVVVSQTS